jgi:hypothetical protein
MKIEILFLSRRAVGEERWRKEFPFLSRREDGVDRWRLNWGGE